MKNSFSRRDFIRYSSLLSGLMAASPLKALSVNDTWNHRRGVPQKVIILGAGLSGLSAAIELRKLGHEVSIYEARMRAGGRVQTLRAPLADNLYADLGAARIPANHDWTMKYIHELGLKTIPFHPHELDFLHVVKGKKIRYKNENTLPPLSEYPLNLTNKEIEMGWEGIGSGPFADIMKNVGDTKSMSWPPEKIAVYDKYTFKEFIIHQGYSESVADLLMLGYEEESGLPVSVLEIFRELDLSFGTTRNKIVGGNDLLPRGLADRLSSVIQYGAEVKDVRQENDKVTVSISKRGEIQQLSADRVICTFPCPVLRKFDFINTLSGPKQKAIREMNYYSLSRTVIQVKDRYWRKDGLNAFTHTDTPTEIWDPLYESKSGRGLIAAYIKGSNSKRFNSMSENEQFQFSADHVNDVFPGLYDHIEGGYTKCWDQDKWSAGATSLGGPTQMTQLQPHLGTQEGRIHFAGEHTSAFHGWMQGAIESGNRVAKEINNF